MGVTCDTSSVAALALPTCFSSCSILTALCVISSFTFPSSATVEPSYLNLSTLFNLHCYISGVSDPCSFTSRG